MHQIAVNSINFSLPSSFPELHPKQLRGFLATVFSAAPELEKRVQLVHLLAPAKAQASLRKLNDVQFAQLASVLRWATGDLPAEAVPAKFRHKGVEYHGPRPNMETSVLAEFLFADTYLLALKDQPEMLPHLLACLWRPADEQKSLGDVRQKFDTDELQKNAEALADAPEGIQLAAVAYQVATKRVMASTYPKIFAHVVSGEGDEVQSSGEWANVMLSIAETGTFGKMEEVKYTNLHEIFLFLEKKQREAEKLEREAKKHRRRGK